jgi:protein prenyltransferase alpha subunit repeat containing protein 1
MLPQLQCQKDISDRLASEFAIVLKSGERHRNNYYAFQHARRLLTLSDPLRSSQRLLIKDIGNNLLPWCLDHPSDTSGWSFLYFILTLEERKPLEAKDTIEKVFGFVDSTRWQREALWIFLRTARMNQGLLSEDIERGIVQRFESMLSSGCSMPDISIIDPIHRVKI